MTSWKRLTRLAKNNMSNGQYESLIKDVLESSRSKISEKDRNILSIIVEILVGINGIGEMGAWQIIMFGGAYRNDILERSKNDAR